MAEIPRLQPFRTGVTNVPGAATPNVSFGQQVDVGLPYRAAAQYQGTVAQTLDRISTALFGEATELRKKEGLQFAAANQLTREQLQAMAKGDMSDIDMGSPQTAFGSTLRKARAIELSGHLEMEARTEVADLLQRYERNEIDFEGMKSKLDARINAGGEALAGVDPDASYKYRATMSTYGAAVIEKAAALEGKRRMLANTVKLQRDYSNLMQGIAAYATSQPFIDPETGNEFALDEITDYMVQNFLNNATLTVGVTGAQEYAKSIGKDIADAKVNAITQHIVSDEFFGKPGALDRLQAGDAGKATYGFSTLSDEDRRKVIANYMGALSNKRSEMEAIAGMEKVANEAKSNEMLIEYFNPSTTAPRKKQIALDLANMKVFTVEQMEKFLGGGAGADEYTIADLETAIYQNRIEDSSELRKQAIRLGLNGKQYQTLNAKLLGKLDTRETSANKIMRNAAGLPDVITVRSKDDTHKFSKEKRIKDIYTQLRTNAIREGKAFSPEGLAYDAVNQYNETDAKDSRKNSARSKINNTVKNLIETKKLPVGSTIDENTNIDDLERQKIVDAETAAYLRKEQNILRSVPQ